MARKASGKGKRKGAQKQAFGKDAASAKKKRSRKAPASKAAQSNPKGSGGRAGTSKKREIEQYDHADAQRLNNPEVGLVNAATDPDKTSIKKTYAYDPHLDPELQFDRQGALSDQFEEQVTTVERAIEYLEARVDDLLKSEAEAPADLAEAITEAREQLKRLRAMRAPYVNWAGKAEHTSFEVDSVSLHVHERIDPRTIIEAVKRKNGGPKQNLLFERPSEKLALREAIDFYRHSHGWSNRLVAGDSLLVMNSLLEKEGLGGQVQMVYIDPPYGIKYGSNFQPFVNKRDVKDRKDEDLTQEPEMIRAFRDTWELGIHSYLTYLRDRLLLARALLNESGSCFVQISDENLHHVRELMDEVFGAKNFVALIPYKTAIGMTAKRLDQVCDYIIWYARDVDQVKFHRLYIETSIGREGASRYKQIESPDGTQQRLMTAEERRDPNLIPDGWRAYRDQGLTSRSASDTTLFPVEFEGQVFRPSSGGWRTNEEGMKKLILAGRLLLTGNNISFKKFYDDFPALAITNFWTDTGGGITSRADPKIYAVQTSTTIIQRCLLMATDPGDLVFDPTCGSGTTAYAAEQWGRRWITCDSSRVAVALAKQRLMTTSFDYFELARPQEGVGSGFIYKTIPHVTLGAIANNPDIKPGMSREQIDAAIAHHAPQETLYDQPQVDKAKVRVTGPFTVEAVPAPSAISPEELARDTTVPAVSDTDASPAPADSSVARSGETLRQTEWRDELLKSGVRAKGGRMIRFSRVEPIAGTRWLHCDAETKEDEPQRVVVSFGPEHAPLEQLQVEKAIDEAYNLKPRPKMVLFASFQFDPEAAKDIDGVSADQVGMQVLKVQMNTDLLTEDLKKKRASNESFWLVGQPDVALRRQTKAEREASASILREQLENDPKRLKAELNALKDMYVVEVAGFDYYDPRTGKVDGGGADKIAMWMLDPDYNGRSLYPRQVFFPMAGKKEGWARLAKSLKAELDEDLIEAYRGTVSLPFQPGPNRTVAVKIIDDRGIESLRLLGL